VTGNNKVWRKFTFSPITTSKIRVFINQVPDSWSRVVEIQAFGTSAGGEKVQWLVPDHLGTPRIILDQTGSLANVKRHDYLPFGEELYAGTGGRTVLQGYTGLDGVRQQFTSKERDVETGLDYFLARYYSGIQGRFTSPDEFKGGPIELYILGSGDGDKQALPFAETTNPQSLNKYSYAYNNPLRFVDPDGHQGIVDQLMQYLGRLWKAENPQDGMIPGSGNGEVQKADQYGPLDWDANRLTKNATWNLADSLTRLLRSWLPAIRQESQIFRLAG